MTDGMVEKIGWLPLGGYRIGVRSPGGGYFYYAHLSSYAENFCEGDQVKAGEILGFLGDTGYGEERIGVRSPGGGYFYYAHLSSYAENFCEGDQVKAGEILGFLGDTGYGEEGTTGKFPPHLHLGIYISAKGREEYPLNPYPVLQFLQEKQKNFFY